MALFLADPARYEPQYGGFCASGAAFAIKLGSDPTAWTVYDGRLVHLRRRPRPDGLGRRSGLERGRMATHNGRPSATPAGAPPRWRPTPNKVPYYQTGAQIKAEWLARNPGGRYPDYDPGGMVTNLFLKPPGWRAAEGFGQPALGYPR